MLCLLICTENAFFFEEEGGDLPQSESHSDGEEEEDEKPQKFYGDSQGVVQGCTPVT